jgi:two-component system NarL family response regulator
MAFEIDLTRDEQPNGSKSEAPLGLRPPFTFRRPAVFFPPPPIRNPMSANTVTSRAIRVLIADDQPIVRQGLETALQCHTDLVLVGSTGLGPAAFAAAESTAPDVMVVELEGCGCDGLSFLAALHARRLSVKVLVFSSQDGDDLIHEALERGAVGYLLKTTPVPDIITAIRAAARGRVRPSPEVAARLADHICYPRLSSREIEVLGHAAAGRSNKQIACDLGLSESTIKNHMRRLMGKLQASDRTQSVTLALRRGILGVEACYRQATEA